MIFYSHSKTDSNGNAIGSKTLKEHTTGVLQKALQANVENLNFGIEQDKLNKFIKTIASLHDFGKFTTFFQDYLLKKETDRELKQHARIGGITAFNMLKETDKKLSLIGIYIIFRHHTQLCDILDFPKVFDENLNRIFLAQVNDLKANLKQIEEILTISEINKYLIYPDEREIRRSFKIWAKREPNIKDYYLINYVFSLLIEADKLDASDTNKHSIQDINETLVDKRFKKPKLNLQTDLKSLTNNELRNFCRAEVTSNLLKEDILDNFVFTLTAPTGIGKTMTALDFALRLKTKIKKKKGISVPIIYALPFINIIEQALKEYKTTLPKNIKILGHYQFADVFGKDKKEIDNGGAIKNYNQKLMSLDTWQSDVVITSFVQFFETLIGNRNKLLKKFDHYANAIVILDEVQTLRLDQMPLIGAALFYLSKFLKTRIILMTATKPKIFELAQEEILSKEGETVKPLELLPSHKKVFSLFKRTKIVPLIDYKFEEDCEYDFFENIFLKKWNSSMSCLIVCNTVNRSIQLFNVIKKYVDENGLNNPLEYLSTNIIPAHRKERVEKIKNNINQNNAPVVVSTQVVEAGVDLDFDMGFRDIGPIDSIIQIAGRINRNNNPQKTYSPIYVVDFGDASKIYGQITTSQSIKSLQSKTEFKEDEYFDLIDQYFDNISSRSSFSRFNKIFESMKHLRYDSPDRENERPVSSFKIIDESNSTISVFVETDKKAIELKQKYLDKLSGIITIEEFDEKYKTDFQQRIIAVPDYLAKNLKPINEDGDNLVIVRNEVIRDYYNNETGFIRKTRKEEIVYML